MITDVVAVDPFDLPEWLGVASVTWTASSSVRGARQITGSLCAEGEALPCDLLAADVAYPEPVLDDRWRRAAHQAWEHGQVLLVSYAGRLTLAVPGTSYSADGVLESIGRLAKAVGGSAGGVHGVPETVTRAARRGGTFSPHIL